MNRIPRRSRADGAPTWLALDSAFWNQVHQGLSQKSRQGFTAGLFSHSPLPLPGPCQSLPQAVSIPVTSSYGCVSKQLQIGGKA